jgi:hypothetical protein|tara:strand:- start:116 stop:385 length:270 start_codon:yes stop_codon:yes gene_type:complete
MIKKGVELNKVAFNLFKDDISGLEAVCVNVCGESSFGSQNQYHRVDGFHFNVSGKWHFIEVIEKAIWPDDWEIKGTFSSVIERMNEVSK